jgi:hypothetical protein
MGLGWERVSMKCESFFFFNLNGKYVFLASEFVSILGMEQVGDRKYQPTKRLTELNSLFRLTCKKCFQSQWSTDTLQK